MDNNARSSKFKKIASGLSNVLDPRILIGPVAYLIAISNSNSFFMNASWVLLLLALTTLPVAAFIAFQTRKKIFENNQVPNSRQRKIIYIIGICGILLNLLIMIVLSGPKALIALEISMLIAGFVAAIINTKMKVSVHTGAIAGAVISLIASWGKPLLPLIVLIPLMGWARVASHAHTTTEVILGALIGTAIPIAVFYLLCFRT
jgi:hypothetical protein